MSLRLMQIQIDSTKLLHWFDYKGREQLLDQSLGVLFPIVHHPYSSNV